MTKNTISKYINYALNKKLLYHNEIKNKENRFLIICSMYRRKLDVNSRSRIYAIYRKKHLLTLF